MTRIRATLAGTAAALLLWSAAAGPSGLEAQDARPRLPLEPVPERGLSVSPMMEGWYENEDGTYTISYGYFNRNRSDTIRIPVGERNAIRPAEFSGMQPTTFLPGRHHGVFTVTIPGERRDEDIWWSIRNPNGELHENPGRARIAFYELDHNPRPHGTLSPLVWFESEEGAGRGPDGPIAAETIMTSVDSPVTLTVHVRDPSERDPDDHRFRDGVPPVRVLWFDHSTPAPVQFSRHEDTPAPEEEEENGENGDPREVMLPDAAGTARVVATFTEPGEYVLRVRVDNFSAPDSSSGDQCCWTNGYVTVSVAP